MALPSAQGRYVPPHLRHLIDSTSSSSTGTSTTSSSSIMSTSEQRQKQPPGSSSSSSSSASYLTSSAMPTSTVAAPFRSQTHPYPPPLPFTSASQSMPRTLSNSRTPWSRPDSSSSTSFSTASPYPQPHTNPLSQSQLTASTSVSASASGSRSPSPSRLPTASSLQSSGGDVRTNGIGPKRMRGSGTSLYVFGDSFVGPFKLLKDECVRVQTFKGSSAKGLNNPNSIKQVSSDLLPILNNLLAPPPYAYIPQTGRFALLIFGNVDLQINYLWQLQHKPITSQTFNNSETKNDVNGHSNDGLTASASEDILANATETSLRGPALGPERFVDTVLREYTTWLKREIVDGPIGTRAKEMILHSDSTNNSSNPTVNNASIPRPHSASAQIPLCLQSSLRRKAGPCRVIIAGALPPLVTDEVLPRIPEKYVERLEEDHTRAHQAMERAATESREAKSRTPWALNAGTSSLGLEGGSLGHVNDGAQADRVRGLESDDVISTAKERDLDLISEVTAKNSVSKATSTTATMKTSITSLLQHDPPLCTKAVRVQMTARFNEGLKTFCEMYPHILTFIDITGSMLAEDATSTSTPTLTTTDRFQAVDRSTWACPVDPSNIHPLWEPTLPLWLKSLESVGVPTKGWEITEAAEETFKAYEIDKRRRTEESGFQIGGPIESFERLKIRDE